MQSEEIKRPTKDTYVVGLIRGIKKAVRNGLRSMGYVDTDLKMARDDAKIAFATLDYQSQCQCKTCRNETILTMLRYDHLFRDCPDKCRWVLSVLYPFCATEMSLLDTEDEEVIQANFSALAERIEAELLANARERSPRSVRLRGLVCEVATRH
jgi:hypothetical protein